MKFISPVLLFALLSVANALPTDLEVRAEPSNSPIDVSHSNYRHIAIED